MGFGSYETAWLWLQKLRWVMVRQGRDKLSEIVEVDETFIGGIEIGSGTQGRGAETKTLVIVATECIGKQIGRVRFKCIEDASSENLLLFIEQNIEPKSTIITDGWTGYRALSKSENYTHQVKTISGSGKEAHVHMVDSLVKRWINGTHQGKVSPKYLPYYLDEFAFRFNRKMSTFRGKLFYRMIQQAVDTEHICFDNIVKLLNDYPYIYLNSFL